MSESGKGKRRRKVSGREGERARQLSSVALLYSVPAVLSSFLPSHLLGVMHEGVCTCQRIKGKKGKISASITVCTCRTLSIG